jgi:quinoprotein glucose dehydrogenase
VKSRANPWDQVMTEANTKEPTPKPAVRGRPILRVALLLIVLGIVYLLLPAPKPPLVIPETDAVSDWRAYGNDAGGTRYSPLDQITPGNVMHLEQAWVYRTGEDYTGKPGAGSAAFEATPLVVTEGGASTMYLSTQSNRVIALNAETGVEKWVFDPKLDTSKRTSERTSRGVSTWPQPGHTPEGEWSRRIFMGTLDARLVCIEASNGRPCAGFGAHGEVDLRQGARVNPNEENVNYQVTSPPAIVRDLVIVGSAIGDNRRVDSERGVVRAYHARTGELVWSWDPIPDSPFHPAASEWEPAQAAKTGAANAWSILSVDAERDLVFVPTGSASPDYFGGERRGSNLYANSTVALRASTGEVVWAFQSVHHDLWDYDVPAQPVLIDVTRDGRKLPAVVQATKMGHVFFFDRDTGEPLFEVEERPVPPSDVPGEDAWPTQPFPAVTEPLVPQTLTADDAWGLTPIDRGMARKRIEGLRTGPIFTPPSLQGTIHYPGVAGGTNWGSVAFDPGRELVILNTSRVAFAITLFKREDYDEDRDYPGVERARQLGTPYIMHREPLLSPLGLPVSPPPWGTLAAVSTSTGRVVWESVLGTPRDLAPVPISFKWGTPNMGGPIVTKSGVTFISATMDYYLRAFDTATGEELWKGRLPAGGQATPMTYRTRPDGKQYVVICAGGHGKMGTKLGDYVIAFALPDAG